MGMFSDLKEKPMRLKEKVKGRKLSRLYAAWVSIAATRGENSGRFFEFKCFLQELLEHALAL